MYHSSAARIVIVSVDREFRTWEIVSACLGLDTILIFGDFNPLTLASKVNNTLQSIADKSRRIQREIEVERPRRRQTEIGEDHHVRNYRISSDRMYMEKVLNGGKRKFIRKGDVKVEVRKFMF